MTYSGLEIFCHCPGCQMTAFAFDLTKLTNSELEQLHENIFNPVKGGIVDHDWERAASAEEEIEAEEARRLPCTTAE